MNIFDLAKGFGDWIKSLSTSRKPSPADFRRGGRKFRGHVVGLFPDRNSRNAGSFKGSIVPMRRRFKGVSKTANK